jgi:hypothetical protein
LPAERKKKGRIANRLQNPNIYGKRKRNLREKKRCGKILDVRSVMKMFFEVSSGWMPYRLAGPSSFAIVDGWQLLAVTVPFLLPPAVAAL